MLLIARSLQTKPFANGRDNTPISDYFRNSAQTLIMTNHPHKRKSNSRKFQDI
mgnify:CR=1 FL=1